MKTEINRSLMQLVSRIRFYAVKNEIPQDEKAKS